MRRQAAYRTLSISEFFRDEGKDVMCMMDLGHAFRHGAARDRPVRRRAADRKRLYADGVHRTAETAGAGRAGHSMKARSPRIFTVLVDGDDHNEPDRGRRARHSRWPYRDAARYRRARPLSCHQHSEVGRPANHAAVVPIRPILADHPAGAAGRWRPMPTWRN